MKDEIKEILDNLKYCKEHDKEKNYYPEDIFSKDEPYILLDYITNLQEEIKSANESITWWTNRFNALQEENERLKNALCSDNIVSKNKYNHLKTLKESLELELSTIKDFQNLYVDYKSRNEKAIEYINENSAFMNDDEWEVFNKKELLNILNGGDDNE